MNPARQRLIYTDQLWVHPDHRKKALGHQLMEAVHDYGRKSGCTMATVATMNFQGAKAFYEKYPRYALKHL
ncbi:MAG TPA: GNAT family N-acetyltransferase [Gammaproteobacteria bacterium]|nr:GNAT family N-acetyltransferase [Gammaproteobacteria bacterium]